MQLHKSPTIQIILLSSLAVWNVAIAVHGEAITLMLTLILLILIPFAVGHKNREDWNDFFSVLILILFPIHSYFFIEVIHSHLLYKLTPRVLTLLWIPYFFQAIVITNYLIVYLKDYYRQFNFYGINALAVLNHVLAVSSIAVISINTIKYFSDRSKLTDLIAKEITLKPVKISDSSKPFFNYSTRHYSTMKVFPDNSTEYFLLPIRDRVMMEYQGNLFEANCIEKKAFSNELLFRSPKDTFVIEIIQSF